MVTLAQARERAESWVNGGVPGNERRDPRVTEFDLGYVVWAEDRADGPTSDGGGCRLVIARDGETTVWPALPVEELVERYRAEYGSRVPEPSPPPPARVDLEATSFLLSPPQWLQEAADRVGIPDHRPAGVRAAGAAAPKGPPGAAAGAAAGSALGAADAAAGSGTDPQAPDTSSPTSAVDTPDTPSSPDPWDVPEAGPPGPGALDGGAADAGAGHAGGSAGGETSGGGSAGAAAGSPAPAGWSDANTGQGPVDPLPPPAFSGADDEPADAVPNERSEARTTLMPGGSGLPATAVAPALDPEAEHTPVPGGPAVPPMPPAPPSGAGAALPPPTGPAADLAPPTGPPAPGPAPDGAADIADAETAKAAAGGSLPPRARHPEQSGPAGPPPAPGAAGSPPMGYVPTQMVPALDLPAASPLGAPPPVPGGPGPSSGGGGGQDPHAAATMLARPSSPPPGPGAPPPPPPAPGVPGAVGQGTSPSASPLGAPPPVPGGPGPSSGGGGGQDPHAAATMLARPSSPPPGPAAPPPPPGTAPGVPGMPPPPPLPPAPGGPGPVPMGPMGTAPPPPPAVPPPAGGYGFPQPPQGVPVVGPGYMAVLRYRAADGSEQQIIRRSAPGTPHPEWQILHELRSLNVPPQQVLELHTELESCDLPGGYCARMVRENWPQVRVSHTAGYGRDHASRQQGVRHLLTHQGELAQVADGPARPHPQRVPPPDPGQVGRVPAIPLDGIGYELAQAFGPQAVFRFDQRAVARQGVPDLVAQTLVWSGLPVDFGPFFWARAQPGMPVPTLAEVAAERGVAAAPDAGAYLVMGNDFGRQLCVQYGTANIMAVPLEAVPGTPASPAQYVNNSLPEFARCLALLGRMWRLRLGLTPDQAGRWTVDFQAQLAALDPTALAAPDHWWAVLLEQMWDGLL